ncbi:MAG: hypothetical protein RIQ60_3289 [Pseudomonadota bacterium]
MQAARGRHRHSRGAASRADVPAAKPPPGGWQDAMATTGAKRMPAPTAGLTTPAAAPTVLPRVNEVQAGGPLTAAAAVNSVVRAATVSDRAPARAMAGAVSRVHAAMLAAHHQLTPGRRRRQPRPRPRLSTLPR